MKRNKKRIVATVLSLMMLFGITAPQGFYTEEASAASEVAIANKTWDEVEKVLKTKLGTGYNEVGLCTGFVYWALKNAYGVDWGDNSTVSGLEDKLQDKGMTKVSEGTNGSVTSAMKPGDIIIFLEGGSGSHCAILGEGGKMYHATTTDGVKYGPTLAEWMSYPPADKNCDSYRIYRGLNSTGSLSIVKKSANTDITKDNSCYSLEGAKYGLYQGSTLVGTLTTDKNGKASLDGIPYGSYTLKEISASKGYAVDTTSYKITIDNQTTSQDVSEKPMGDPTSAVVYKLDADTHESWAAGNLPQGSASLENAQYTVKYYDGYYTDSTDFSKLKATRSWVIKTDKNGKTMLTDDLLVSGDKFYRSSSGAVTLPLGTLTIQETKAPEGYLLDDTLHVRQITEKGTIEAVDTYNIPLHKEEVKRGGVKISKNDTQTKTKEQGDATFAGAEFAITNNSDNPVSVDGKEYAKGQVVKVITTNDKGIAQTSADCLPYGEYLISEQKAPEGYLNEGVLERSFSIKIDGEIVDLTKEPIINDVIRGGVQLQKWDRELAKSEAIAAADHSSAEKGAKLTDIEFTITNKSKNSVIAGGKEYAPGDVIATLKTAWNEEKDAYTVETPADFLPYGTYELKETKSNDSYMLTDGKARTFTIREHGKIVTVDKEGIELIFRNFVKRSDLELTKVKDESQERLAGVPFSLTNVTTNETHVIVTDDNGYVSTHADWNKHTHNTNANDKLLELETITKEDVDMTAGIYFGLGENGSIAEPNDTLGALPYGTYIMNELRCEANAKFDLIENVTIVVSRNDVTIDIGTITNDESNTVIEEPEPEPEPDKPQNPQNPQNPEVPKTPEKVITGIVKTGDEVPAIVIAAGLLLVLSAVVGIRVACRKRQIRKRQNEQERMDETDEFYEED